MIEEEKVFSFPESPPSWISAGLSRGEGGDLAFTGVSRRFATEQEARNDAILEAREQIADYLHTEVSREIRKVTVSSGTSSQILDPVSIQDQISKLLSRATLVGTAGIDFYIEKWLQKRGGYKNVFWKAYVLVSFPEKKNQEIRNAVLQGTAQRKLDRLEDGLRSAGHGAFSKERIEEFQKRLNVVRRSFEDGKYVEAIAQSQALLDRMTRGEGARRKPDGGRRNPDEAPGSGQPAPETGDALESSGKEGNRRSETTVPPPGSRTPEGNPVEMLPGGRARGTARPVVPLVGPPSSPPPDRDPSSGSLRTRLTAENLFYDPRSRRPFHLLLEVTSNTKPMEERNPVILALVLDTSGSMKEEKKLDYLKESAWALIRQLSHRDRIAVVVFNFRSQVVIPPTTIKNKDYLRRKLELLTAGGMTNLSGGLLEGWGQLGGLPGTGLKRLIVVTDGLANEGITRRDRLTALVRRYKESGVTTSTMGVGREFDEKLLIALAEAGAGNYYYVEEPDRIGNVLRGELGALRRVVAQNVSVTVKPSPGWRVDDISTYEATFGEDGSASFALGDVVEDNGIRILVALKRTDSKAPRDAAFRAEVIYDDVVVKLSRSAQAREVRVRPARSRAEFRKAENRDVLVQIELARGLHEIECAMDCLEGGALAEARTILEKAKGRISRSAQELDSAELGHQSDVIGVFLNTRLSNAGMYAGPATLSGLRKLLAGYWYAASRNKVCPHCGVKHSANHTMKTHASIQHGRGR